jgi:O-antigen/teichoic acid export membrane protein
MGVRYLAVGVISLAGSTYLIRRVGPEAWAAYSVGYFLATFAEQTFGASLLGGLVRGSAPSRREIAAAAGLGHVAGLTLALALLVASLWAGDWYGDERLTTVLIGVAGAYYLAGIRSPAIAVLERGLRYGWVATGEVLDNITFTAVAIAGLASGYGFDSIAVALAVRNLPATIVLCAAARTPIVGRLYREPTHRLLSFATPALGYAVFALLNGLAAALVLGGSHARELAFFMTASSIIGYAAITLVVVQRVGFPSFAALQADRQELAGAVDRTTRLTAFLMTVSILPVAASSPIWLPWLFGEAWQPAGMVMVWLGVGLLGLGFTAVLTAASNAVGRIRDSFVAQAGSTVLYLALALALSRNASWTLGVPIALAVSRFAATAYLLLRLRRVGIAMPWRWELVLAVGTTAALVAIGEATTRSQVGLLLIPVALAASLMVRRDEMAVALRLLRRVKARSG